MVAAEHFVRHRGPVTCVAGIPNRSAAVSCAYDGAVAYADLESGALMLLGYHDHLVNKITVNAAGTMAASSSSDYTVSLWNLVTRERERALLGHSDDVEDFAFVDDRTGVSVSRDWRILVWNLETGAVRRVIEGHEKDVLSVVVGDGRIYTSGDDMTLRVWDLDTGRLIRKWGPFADETDSCAVDTARGRVVLGCDDGMVRIFDIDSGHRIAEIEAHASGIKKVATSPLNGNILSAAYDQRIVVWNADTLDLELALESRPSIWERSLNWTPDGTRILSGTFDGTVLLWDARTGGLLQEVGESGSGNACFNDVAGSRSGRVATVADDGVLRIGRLTRAGAEWLAEVEPASGRILANAVALDEEYAVAVTGTHDQKLHIFSYPGELAGETEVTIGEGPINTVRVSHHPGTEGHLFLACYSGAIVHTAQDGEVLSTIHVHSGAVKSLRLHPTRRIGVSCSADGDLLSWDFDGTLIRRFPGHMAIVDDVDIDPSGRQIASVSRDFTLKVYDLEDGTMTHSVSLGRRSPKAVCFWDPDVVLVTNYWGSLIRVALSTGNVLTRPLAKNGISGITRCGDDIAVVSYDGAAYLVDPESLNGVQTLGGMAQRLQPSALI